MKIIVGVDYGSYIFDPTNKKVDINGLTALKLEQVLIITNVTSNIVIYDFSNPDLGGVMLDNVITLDYNTAAMTATDSLQIFLSYVPPPVIVDDSMNNDQEEMVVGSLGPLGQHAKEQSNYDSLVELLTFDTNLHQVFGQQRLINQGRLMVEDAMAPDILSYGGMALGNQEVILLLNGHSAASVQLSGTWTGTVTFYCTVDYTSWQTIAGNIVGGITGYATTATSNNIFTFGVAGLKAIKAVFTTVITGRVYATIAASVAIPVSKSPTIAGNLNTIQQRASTFEQLTWDTNIPQLQSTDGLIKDALTAPQYWHPNMTYNVGDTILYNNQMYICIATHSSATAGNVPTNATYWLLDKRMNKSLVAPSRSAAPISPRLQVENDMAAYTSQLQERQLIFQQIALQQLMQYNDYDLCLKQDQTGKQFYMGQSSASMYAFEEIR